MRGLTDLERAVLESPRVGHGCRCTGHHGRFYLPVEGATLDRLHVRGLVAATDCIVDRNARHPVVTALGRTALMADAAARGQVPVFT